MRRLVVLSMLAAGCGFPLTPGAVPCGNHPASRIEVWVDGVSESHMTCEQAMLTVTAAIAIGDSHDFWLDKGEHEFLYGMRLEFIGDHDLEAIGEAGKNGFTMNSPVAHDMAVAYGGDGRPDYTVPYTRGAESWPSAVILAHEMVHVLQTDSFLNLSVLNTHTDKHCNWATSYAPRFADLGWAQFSSLFYDGCQHKTCSGAACKDDP